MPQSSDTKVSPMEIGSVALVMLSALGTLRLPDIVSKSAMHDGWISVPLAGIYGFIVLACIWALSKRFPGQTLVQYAPRLLGPIAGPAIALLFLLASLIWLGVILRGFTDFVLITSLPKTPISVVVGMMVFVIVTSARHDFIVCARLCFLLTPVALALTLLVIAQGVAKMDIANLQPVMVHGPKQVLSGALTATAFFGSVNVFAMFTPFCHNQAGGRRAVGWFFLATVVILTIATLGVNAVFADLSGRFVYPFFSFARVASTGPVAFRSDAFIVSLELLLFSAKTIVWAFAISYGLAQLLRLSDHKSMVIPVTLSAGALGVMLFGNATQVEAWWIFESPFFAGIIQLGIPAILLFAAFCRRKGVRAGRSY
ncbi:MAG TPA: endospore germination permease [Limnochordia bacterium]|nr:endospore germination permease [Limnochordia bacterium]